MSPRTRRILRPAFLIIGALFALLGLGTLTLWLVLAPPGNPFDALRGGFTYLLIAAICFYTARRMRVPRTTARGFEVVPKPADQPTQT